MKPVPMKFGEFLERESRRYSRRLDEEEEAKSL